MSAELEIGVSDRKARNYTMTLKQNSLPHQPADIAEIVI